jgi:hypothetical protein
VVAFAAEAKLDPPTAAVTTSAAAAREMRDVVTDMALLGWVDGTSRIVRPDLHLHDPPQGSNERHRVKWQLIKCPSR